MARHLISFLLASSLLLAVSSVVSAEECLESDVDSSIVVIRSGAKSYSTGVFVSPTSIITVAHGLVAGMQPEVLDADVTVTSIDLHEGHDLAILTVDEPHASYISLAIDRLQLSTSVVAAGYGNHQRLTFSSGNLLSQKMQTLLVSLSIRGGDSGGPLLVCTKSGYQVAGILQAFRVSRDSKGWRRTGVSVAVSAVALQAFLNAANTSSFQVVDVLHDRN